MLYLSRSGKVLQNVATFFNVEIRQDWFLFLFHDLPVIQQLQFFVVFGLGVKQPDL